MKFQNFVLACCISSASSLLCSTSGHAVELSLSGSHSSTNFGYNRSTSRSLSASIAFMVTQYIRIGYTHTQNHSEEKGYEILLESEEIDDIYAVQSTKTFMKSHAIDLAFILYHGQVITPYIFIGGVEKHYYFDYALSNTYTNDEATGSSQQSTDPDFQGGMGLSIRLNRDFSLKMTYTVSKGIKSRPNQEEEKTYDKALSFGLTYHL